MRIELAKPVCLTEGSPPITELILREEVVAGDLRGLKIRALEDPSTDDLLKIAGRLAAQPDAVMNKLGVADALKVLEATGSFFAAGLETGTKP